MDSLKNILTRISPKMRLIKMLVKKRMKFTNIFLVFTLLIIQPNGIVPKPNLRTREPSKTKLLIIKQTALNLHSNVQFVS